MGFLYIRFGALGYCGARPTLYQFHKLPDAQKIQIFGT